MARKYDNPKRAYRYAKTIASDIKLYNMKVLEKAIFEDNVFEALADQIEEGRSHYKDRVTPDIYEMNIYEHTLVDVLLYEMRNVKSSIW
ncbi:MAG: hypothetical protein PF689_11705 [Deltaproteobacteria bacterium]|jgi:hypothetical protein|nr:hypothetical protein [Deltaproteobacteria bacterium]